MGPGGDRRNVRRYIGVIKRGQDFTRLGEKDDLYEVLLKQHQSKVRRYQPPSTTDDRSSARLRIEHLINQDQSAGVHRRITLGLADRSGVAVEEQDVVRTVAVPGEPGVEDERP